MRTTLLTLSGLLALALPATALAKEVSAMKVCGPSACTTLRDRALLTPLVTNAGPQAATPRPAPFYRVTILVSEPGHGLVGSWKTWYVRSAALFQGRDEGNSPYWYAPSERALAYVNDRLAHLEPYAAPRFTRIELGTTSVRDPGSYTALFDPRLARATEYADDWKPLTITAKTNPWTDGVLLSYSPSQNVFWHGSERVRLPDRLAANLEAGRSALAAAPAGASPWGWIGGGAGAALVFGGGIFGFLRFRK
jgi:hypothetical protein